MFAVVDIQGQQFEVEPYEIVTVPLIDAPEWSIVDFLKIIAAGDDKQSKIGSPTIEGKVTAKILAHGKGKKVLVFHKKRRKGHRKLNGHRQRFSSIVIIGMDIDGFEAFAAPQDSIAQPDNVAEQPVPESLEYTEATEQAIAPDSPAVASEFEEQTADEPVATTESTATESDTAGDADTDETEDDIQNYDSKPDETEDDMQDYRSKPDETEDNQASDIKD